jgi:hypothetical protein
LGGDVQTCITYRVIEPESGLETNSEYVGYIVQGLRERGVPSSYIDGIKAIAMSNNPAIAEQLEKL